MSKLKEKRQAKGWSREQLSVKSNGVSASAIEKYETERGQNRRLPRVDYAIKIARALKTSVEKLWG